MSEHDGSLALPHPHAHATAAINPTATTSTDNDLQLAQRAANGEPAARATLTRWVDPLVRAKAGTLCKRFCRENRYQHRCTVDPQWGTQAADRPLCEWGNASYAHLFAELVKPETLRRYEGRGGCSLRDFLRSTLHSLGVTERWKDMRFSRRINVPACVEELGPQARRLFLWLCDGDTVPNMAQRLGKTQAEVAAQVRAIFAVLITAGCSYTLQPSREISLTALVNERESTDDGSDNEYLPAADEDPPQAVWREQILAGLDGLDAVSRFVLKAKFWEDLPMQDILDILKAEGIALKPDVAPEETTLNQLYYFYYQALNQLRERLGFRAP